MGSAEWDLPYISRVSHRRPISRKGELVAFVSALDPCDFAPRIAPVKASLVRFGCPSPICCSPRSPVQPSRRSFAVDISFSREIAPPSGEADERAVSIVRPSPDVLAKSWRSCRVPSMWTSATPEVSAPLCLLIPRPESFNSRSSIVEPRSSSPPRAEPLFSADNAGWNQLIFAFATRPVGRVAPKIRLPLPPAANGSPRCERGGSISGRTGDLPAKPRITVASAVFRSYDGAGREGGGCPSLPFFHVLRLFSSRLPLTAFGVFVNGNFPKI